MIYWALSLILGGFAVLLLPFIVKGIKVADMKSAVILVLAMTGLRFLVELVFWWIILPLKFLTLGLVTVAVNTFCLDLASDMVPGISIDSFKSALMGSVLLSVIWSILNYIIL